MGRLGNIKAAIFDLDDTLYPHKLFAIKRFWKIAKMLGKSKKEKRGIFFWLLGYWKRKTSMYPRLFDDLIREFKLNANVKDIVNCFNAFKKEKMKLDRETKNVLSILRKKGIKMGLLTDGNVERQLSKIKSLELEKYFDVIMNAKPLGTKRSEKPFKEILKKLGVHPEKAIYVGDNPFLDFKIPKKLGMTTIRVRKGEFKEIESDQNVDIEIKNLRELLKIL